VSLINHTINSGKGQAVRTGLGAVQGDYVLIQDADLEYDPQDYLVLLPPVLNGDIDVVYGSRYLKGLDRGILNNLIHAKHPKQTWAAYIGGRSISLFAWAFTGRFLNDTVTAYKLFPAQLICNMKLVTTGFELDHEISCKVLAGGHRIKEVPIRYYPRTVADGKKIGLKDWFIAIKTFYRFRNG
jgi:glycosyltransferase involved in cell wall biosynthesis